MISQYKFPTALIHLLILSKSAASLGVDFTQHRLFSDQLTSQIYTSPNEFSSALGVSMAFSLIYPGSTNDAAAEISASLGYLTNGSPNSNMQLVWEDVSTSLTSRADGTCGFGDGDSGMCYGGKKPLLSIANSIWIDDGDALNVEYEAVVGNYSKQIDFQSTDSPQIINSWVNNQTNGLVDSIVQEGTPLPGVLIAINSLYLKASWANPFYESNTNLDSFYSSTVRSDEVSKAHFMHRVGKMRYSHDVMAGYQIAQLPFAASSMSMVFVLPTTETNENMALVPSSTLIPALTNLKETRVALALPKFKFESEYDDNLKEALQNIGVVSPFKGGTQSLCNIFAADIYPCEQLFISKILQKTVIDVNEDGVEAAAVTAIFIEKTSSGLMDQPEPVLMMLNHPFQFFIYDQDEELVLFEGRLGELESQEEEPTSSMLDLVHADEDFWQSSFGVNPVNPPILAIEDESSASSVGANIQYALVLACGVSAMALGSLLVL